MNDFQRQIYADMESVDRIFLWMIKWQEFMEFSKLLTDQDIKRLYEVCDLMKKINGQKRSVATRKEDNDG